MDRSRIRPVSAGVDAVPAGRGGDRDRRLRPVDGRLAEDRSGKPDEEEARRVLDRAFAEHRPIALYAMFSGGHDSLVAAHLAAQHPRFTACVHIDTGIGIEETREFVRQTCHREGWPLVELVTPPSVYEELVLTYGFPGYGMHSGVYQRLKERRLAELLRQAKAGRSRLAVVALATGIRRLESVRRMGRVVPLQKEGSRLWAAPLHAWSGIDVREYMALHRLPSNPVVDLLHMSGECLCGSFARPGELAEISLWYPRAAARIFELERRVLEAGSPPRPWGWTGDKMGTRALCQQCRLRDPEVL
jgi:3'-phosphoadenosine 5'-phosphosulfate sulfotransferase (PAPS reductase)/FAD synthetase